MKDQKVAPIDSVAPTPAVPTMTDLPAITDPAAYTAAAACPEPAPVSCRDAAAYAAQAANLEAPAPAAGLPVPEPAGGHPVPGQDMGEMAVPEHRAGAGRLGDPVAVWPCAGCGRPVPQPVRGARTVRYCQGTDGRCERTAREGREQARESPGLTGQVAWTWEMVERLESVADRLAGSLTGELSVAGVERRVAEARAEAAGHIAIAQRERDATQRQAEIAWRETATVRDRAEAAEREAAAASAAAERAAAERDAAREECQEAKDAAEASAAARLATENERDRVTTREGELLSALETARSELVTLHARLSQAETLVEGQRVEAAAEQRTAEDLRNAVGDAEAKRGQAVADRDQIQARAREFEQHNWQLSRTADELRAAVKALTAERDAARAEADRARRRVDALIRHTDGRQDGGPRPVVDREPPTGLHTLAPMPADPLNRGTNGYHFPDVG